MKFAARALYWAMRRSPTLASLGADLIFFPIRRDSFDTKLGEQAVEYPLAAHEATGSQSETRSAAPPPVTVIARIRADYESDPDLHVIAEKRLSND